MKKTLVLVTVLSLIVALSACTAFKNEFNPNLPTQTSSVAAENQNLETLQTPAPNTPSVEVSVPSAPANEAPALITREEALNAALNAAGLKRADVFDVDVELDRERGVLVWEVEFETLKFEYSYDVNANDGTVTKSEREFND